MGIPLGARLCLEDAAVPMPAEDERSRAVEREEAVSMLDGILGDVGREQSFAEDLARAPQMVRVLLAVNVAVWLMTVASGGSTDLPVLVRFGAQVNLTPGLKEAIHDPVGMMADTAAHALVVIRRN